MYGGGCWESRFPLTEPAQMMKDMRWNQNLPRSGLQRFAGTGLDRHCIYPPDRLALPLPFKQNRQEVPEIEFRP